MPKTMTDVKTFLEGTENGQEYYQAIDNAILHERATSKGMVDAEKRKSEPLIEAVKNLGFDSEKGDLESFVKGMRENLENGKASKDKLTDSEKRFLAVEGQLTDLSGKLATSEENRGKAENTLKNGKIREALISKLNGKIYSAEVHAGAILQGGNATLAEDGKTVQWKDGDTISELSTGIDSYLERHKDSVINGQKGGAGQGDTGGDKGGAKTITRKAYDQYSTADKLSFTRDGGKVVD